MKKKILLLFLALFLLFVAGITFALRMVRQTTSSLDALITLHKVEIIRQDLVINVQTVQSNLYTSGTLFGKELDVIVDNVLRLREAVARCGGCHHEPPVAEGIVELQDLTEQYKEALSFFITSTADRQRVSRLQSVAADIGDTIITKSQAMAITANNRLHQRTKEAAVKVEKSEQFLIYTLSVAFVAALAIAFYLIRSITEPVSELLKATRRLRAGELGALSPYTGRDEFKELFESFNLMSCDLAAATEEMRTHLVRNQTILQTSIDGFLHLDGEGRILDANPASCRMVGYPVTELRGTSLARLQAEAEGKEGTVLPFERLKSERSLIHQTTLETREGNTVTVEISAALIDLDDQANIFCFVRDIGERKRLETELLKVQKLESLGVLAGGIAHDFNNLLAGIMGYIDLALRRLEPGEKTHEWLQRAKKASSRAQTLTQQLLTFARGGEPVRQLLSIREVVEDATRFVLSGSNVRCESEMPADLWAVEADRGQLGQVFQNLTLNADQAMPNGGVIRVEAKNVTIDQASPLLLPKGPYVRITFTDQGIGMEEKVLARIFDPYFTTKEKGSGLGLSICHSIVKKHHGHIEVDSAPGAGTTFTIHLPARPAARERAASVAEVKAGTNSGRVLVMDDEEHVRDIAGEMLRQLGYEADFAADGLAALRRYQEALQQGRPFAAVLMDLTIPGGMGGREAVALLLRVDPRARVLVSSGYSNDPVMADFARFGFSGVVHKPYDMEQLDHALQKLFAPPLNPDQPAKNEQQ